MKTKDNIDIIRKMNSLGAERVPFFCLFDFELKKPCVYTLEELPPDLNFLFQEGKNEQAHDNKEFKLSSNPISKEIFTKAFSQVLEEINYGNSFLLNLTFPSQITTNYSLQEIYLSSQAKYKVLWDDKFVCFSPETFVKIKENTIYSYPMKGTIDASIPNAEKTILADPKETAEHYTIVDLIRNDLAQVAKNISVSKFRYVDTLHTHDQTLLQISSEIKGQLDEDWHENIGDIMFTLLPAGSISGAPKVKTVEIIRKCEIKERGFYTGIAAYYNGTSLDSCVMIRFIEKKEDSYYFRSGGGITFKSKADEEYEELKQKIYVPIF